MHIVVSDTLLRAHDQLKRKASPAEVASALRGFVSEAQRLGVPSAPKQCIHVTDEPNRPQPRLDRDLGRGFTVSVGRVRECPVFDVKFVMLSHNTIIGAAGGAIMNAELAKVKGYLD
jgi:aspartate-semialdehyde dehydrogenase